MSVGNYGSVITPSSDDNWNRQLWLHFLFQLASPATTPPGCTAHRPDSQAGPSFRPARSQRQDDFTVALHVCDVCDDVYALAYPKLTAQALEELACDHFAVKRSRFCIIS